MGHPAYVVTGGEVRWKGYDLLEAVRRQARPAGPVPRLPVPDRDPRPVRRVVRAQRAQRQAPGHRQEPRHRPHRHDPRRRLDARLPAPDAREDGPPQDGGQLRDPVRQRRVLGRREEAPRDAPDGDAGAGVRDPRRDRLGPRHRRAADRRRGRQRAAQPEHGRAADHPLPAAAQLHRARLRPRARLGPDRDLRRQGARAAPRGGGLRPDPARERPRAEPARRGAHRAARAGGRGREPLHADDDRDPTRGTARRRAAPAAAATRSIPRGSSWTSRSSTRRSTGIGSCISTPRRRRRSRASSSTRSTRTTAATTRTSTAASTSWPRSRPRPGRARGTRSRR